jgi:WD40 repeat protein
MEFFNESEKDRGRQTQLKIQRRRWTIFLIILPIILDILLIHQTITAVEAANPQCDVVREIVLWNIEAPCTEKIKWQASGLLSVALSADKKNLVTSSWSGVMILWDVTTRQHVDTFNSHQKTVWEVAFSPDGKHLATAGKDGTVKIWDLSNRQELRTIKAHTKDVRMVVYNGTGNRMATAGWDNKVIIWDVNSREKPLQLSGHTRPVNSVSFDSNGSRLVTAASDGSVRIWEADTGRQLLKYKGHTRSVRDAVFSRGGVMIASGSWDKTLQIWDSRTGQIIKELPLNGKVWSVAFSPDDRYVAVASENNPIKVWDLDSKQWRWFLKGHQGRVNKVIFTGEGLISVGDDQTCRWWYMASDLGRRFSMKRDRGENARTPDWK